MLKRKRTWIVLIFLLVIAGGAAVNLTTRSALDNAMAEWRKEGLPANPYDLDLWYKQVPAESNAALIFLEARNNIVFASSTNDPSNIGISNAPAALPANYLAAARDYVTRNRETIERMHEAAELTETRYPVNFTAGFNTLLPHLAQIKSLAQLLKHEAIYQSHCGNREQAIRALHTGFALGRSLRYEPVLISELVRVACIAINLTALERVLSDHQLTAAEIELLASDLVQAEKDGRLALYRALIGERTNASTAFTLNFAQFQALSNPMGAGPPPSAAQQAFGSAMFVLYKAAGLRQRDTRVFLETMHEFIVASTNEFPAAIEVSDAANQRFAERTERGLGRIAIFSRMLLPALTKVINKEATLSARLRASRVALAVEKERLEKGKMPASLGELPADLPRDPYDDQPMELRLEEPGYRIVSLAASKESGTKTNPLIGMRVAR